MGGWWGARSWGGGGRAGSGGGGGGGGGAGAFPDAEASGTAGARAAVDGQVAALEGVGG